MIHLTALFALLFACSTANDMICTPPGPNQCIPREQLKNLLPLPWKDAGVLNSVGSVYVNLQTDQSLPPMLQYVASITGIDYQWYDTDKCTLSGNFSLTSGGVVIPGTTVSWDFHPKLNWNNNNYIGYCLTDPTNGTQGYVLGCQHSQDFYSDIFLANKQYINTVTPVKLGNTVQFETFKFYNDTFSQYQLTQYSTSTTFGPTTIIFFSYTKIANLSSLKRDAQEPLYVANEKYHNIGHVKIPQSLIPVNKQKYFNFV